VTTITITGITTTAATSGGNITSDGGANVTARGVCWNTSSYPTIANTHTSDGTGTGSFISSITGLTANITYHVRAYATNSAGTQYGSDLSFTTLPVLTIPIVTTAVVTNITTITATSGGNVTSDGGSPVTAKGVCWSAGSIPMIANNISNDGTGTGSYVSTVIWLAPGNTYYVRAYATNSAGTGYGSILSFTTLGYPAVTTTLMANITNNGAMCGGTVISTGGDANAYAGVVIAPFPDPTPTYTSIATYNYYPLQHNNPYSISISGLLQPLTTYYYRAYLVSNSLVVYGAEYTFITLGYPQTIFYKCNGAFVKTGGSPGVHGKFNITH
jgi:hypothetical protein